MREWGLTKGVDLIGLFGGHKKTVGQGPQAGSRARAPVGGLEDEAEAFL